MDPTPGTHSPALTCMVTTALPLHRSERRTLVSSWWLRSALVAVVLVLGLLQGTRAALGDVPLGDAAESVAAPADSPAVIPSERGGLRGRFFRPAGSDAVAPQLRVRRDRWAPAQIERFEFVCRAGC